jgi:hypothetical protein
VFPTFFFVELSCLLGVKLDLSHENRMQRRIFGPKREEVARGWRRLYEEGLHNFHTSPNSNRVIIKENKMGGSCCMF